MTTESTPQPSRSRVVPGGVFGRLTAIRLDGVRRKGCTRWLCRCECGVEKVILQTSLVSGNTRSCGCLRKPGLHLKQSKDLRGQVFGRLTVVDRAPPRQDPWVRWRCQCVCGNITETPRTGELTSGRVVSCGCYRKETAHLRGATHGQSRTSPIYSTWQGMKRRCLDPNAIEYANYGGRGIDIDPRWIESFVTFQSEVGNRPGPGYSLDRIDNSRGYWPDNVKWSTRKEQSRNKRTNVYLTHDGRTQVLRDWLRELGASSVTYYQYLAIHGRECVIAALLQRPRRRTRPTGVPPQPPRETDASSTS